MKEKQERADADAGEMLDKILKCLDSLGSRMDAYDAKKDGAEAAAVSDKSKKDAEKEMREVGDPKELAADSRRDSAEVRNELSEIQTRADAVCSAWGQDARRPMQNELPAEYRRRVSAPLKRYSAQWKDVDLKELGGKALEVATDQIFNDAFAAATSNDTFAGGGYLRESRRRSDNRP